MKNGKTSLLLELIEMWSENPGYQVLINSQILEDA